MGRYGHHNNHSRYERRDNSQNENKTKKFNVRQDFDSSRPQRPEPVEQDWDSTEENQPSVIDRLKERYNKYTSPDARMQRRQNELVKRKRKIEDLSYNAKKESLKANIRKAKQTAPTDFGFGFGGAKQSGKGGRRSSSSEGVIHLPRNNYGSMDRMFGIGGAEKPRRQSMPKKTGLTWGNMDRMLGGY